jgi:aminoglycoside 2'-N-acetyltransferase I
VTAEVRTAHTADLDAATLTSARELIADAFGDAFEDADWEHGLGGIHALAWEDGELIGHASVVMRRMLHGGRALRTGYVEAVAVRSDHRRRGHGGALLAPLEAIIRNAYELGSLGATDAGAALYTSRGWQRWEGRLSAITPTGVERTPEEEGYVYVLPVSAPLDRAGELTCDWRDGDVW